jgi:hypothetical protein
MDSHGRTHRPQGHGYPLHVALSAQELGDEIVLGNFPTIHPTE